jgi:hypothetical protein
MNPQSVKKVRAIAVTVALGAAGITTGAGAQTMTASPMLPGIHPTRAPAVFVRAPLPAGRFGSGTTRFSYLHPYSGGCSGSLTLAMPAACWQNGRWAL